MKKLATVFLLLFSLGFFLTAQASGVKKTSSEAGSTGQVETFSWEEVPKARKYGVSIEVLNEKGRWVKFYNKETRKTSVEVELPPGSYRISISTYNVLGKKTASEWTNFYILDESTPYLFDNYYNKSLEWKVPVLYVNFKDKDLKDVSGSRNFITAEKGFDENTFFIKGKNIFSPNVSFYLVPSDRALDGGKEYTPFYTARKEVKLEVVKSDPAKNGVYVSYNKNALYSGYYSLEVRNSMSKDSIGILVLADRPMSISPFEFEQDLRYKVNAINVENKNELLFSVKGKGFDSNTKFSLIPTDVGIDYPYAVNQNRNRVPVNLKDKSNLDDEGTVKIDLTCNARDIKTGYYYIQAENADKGIAQSVILVKFPLQKDSDIVISKISTKYNKRTKKLDFTVKGDNLSKASAITLVSEYSKESGGNVKIPLKLSKSALQGAKFVTSLDPASFIFGDYIMLIETADGISKDYFTIDKHFKTRQITMNDAKAEKTFLRPEEGSSEDINFDSTIVEKVTIKEDQVTVTSKRPYLFPFIRISGATTSEMLSDGGANIDFRFENDIFNNGWFSFGPGVKYNRDAYVESISEISGNQVILTEYAKQELGAEFHSKIMIPNTYFSPYIGGGIGYNLINPETDTDFTNLFPKINEIGFYNSSDLYALTYFGITLTQVLDFRYNFEFHNLLKDRPLQYTRSTIAFGIKMPVRSSVYTRNVVSQGAVITKGGEVNAADYDNLSRLTYLEFDEGVTEVNGFMNYNVVQKISLPASIETIGDQAFKNCANLESVKILGSRLITIGDEAFAGDVFVVGITIPASVTYIGKDAFAGWTSGQTINLMWDADDKVSRNLEGLNNTGAMILYRNGTLAAGTEYKNAFENNNNWENYGGITYTKTSMSYKNSLYPAIHIKGFTAHTDENEISKLRNRNLADALNDSSKLKFKVFGDGNKYMLYICTSGNGYFAKEFNTKNGGTTDVSISLKSLERRPHSKQNKIDGNEIVFAQIVPVVPSNKVPACNAFFFDFEVEK